MKDSEKILELEQKIEKLKKINKALIAQVEKSMDSQGSDFAMFQQNIMLEDKVKERTASLKEAEENLLKKNTELVEMNKKIEEEKKAAETANIAKTTFLANMSHELRTPMHGILSFARYGISDINEKAPLGEIKENFIEIRDSGERLLKLINDLLDLSKLEAGKMVYNRVKNDLLYDIDLVISEIQLLAKEKNLTFDVKSDNDDEVLAIFDSAKIQQVIRNLLSNAIKFSKSDNSIKIEISRNDDIEVRVSNVGERIPESELTSIFNKFIQSSKTKDGSGGTGLGLSIVQQILKDHNGRIWAENGDNGRVYFCFTFPCEYQYEESESIAS